MNDKYIKIQTVVALFDDCSRTTIYRWMADPEVGFPKQYQVGPRRIMWKESEVREWMDSREVTR